MARATYRAKADLSVKCLTTIPEMGVHSSEWKQVPSQVDVDIVWSVWKHTAVNLKDGSELTTLSEHKRDYLVKQVMTKWKHL